MCWLCVFWSNYHFLSIGKHMVHIRDDVQCFSMVVFLLSHFRWCVRLGFDGSNCTHISLYHSYTMWMDHSMSASSGSRIILFYFNIIIRQSHHISWCETVKLYHKWMICIDHWWNDWLPKKANGLPAHRIATARALPPCLTFALPGVVCCQGLVPRERVGASGGSSSVGMKTSTYIWPWVNINQ